MKKKTVLVIAVLTVLVLTGIAGIAGACGGEGEAIEHIAEDLCSMNSSIKLLTYAVIALVLVQLAGLIPLFKKK